jgi:hypothetical protein
VKNVQGLIQITYMNQGGGDAGPATISWNFVDWSSGGSRQVGPLGAGQTAIYGGNRNDQSSYIDCETGRLNVSIAQNQGASVPEVNTDNNSASVVITGNPTCY